MKFFGLNFNIRILLCKYIEMNVVGIFSDKGISLEENGMLEVAMVMFFIFDNMFMFPLYFEL